MTRDIEINGIKYGTTDTLRQFMRDEVMKIDDAHVLYYARKLSIMRKYVGMLLYKEEVKK